MELMKIMVLIKFITILLVLLYFIKNKEFIYNKINLKEYKFIIKYSKWITPNFVIYNLNNLYDKFLIKSFRK